MINKVNLLSEGFPDYELYDDGKLVHIETGKVVVPSDGRNVQLKKNGRLCNVNIPILCRRYFMSELKRIPKENVVNLSFCGFPDYSITVSGRVWTHKSEQWRSTIVSNRGYECVTMSDVNGKMRTVTVHSLVARAFKANPFNYDQIDHIDGNKLNNAAYNLEWVSAEENTRRARLNGLRPMAMADEEVHQACQMIVKGHTNAEIAEALHTYPQLINTIRRGLSHCRISSQYGIKKSRNQDPEDIGPESCTEETNSSIEPPAGNGRLHEPPNCRNTLKPVSSPRDAKAQTNDWMVYDDSKSKDCDNGRSAAKHAV